MEWIDEQIKLWYEKAIENEKVKDKLSIVEYMKPYTNIHNLLSLKINNLYNDKETD